MNRRDAKDATGKGRGAVEIALRLALSRRWEEMNRQDAKDATEKNEPDFEVDSVASALLEAAVEVHRVLGPGLLESVYQQALEHELTLRRIEFVRQPSIAVVYKRNLVGDLRPDLLVARCLIVELKTVDQLAAIHLAQALSYLRTARLSLALIVNFNVPVLLRGVRRVALTRPRSF